MNSRRAALVLALAALASIPGRQTRAGLILDVGSAVISANGLATVDITARSDGSPTQIGQFNFDVFLNGSGTHNAPALTFINPGDLAYRSDPSSNYIFAGESLGSPVDYSSISPTPLPPHQEVGGGDSIDFNNPNVTGDVTVGAVPVLLARLELSASSTAVVGDVYSIVVLASSDPTTSPTGYVGEFSATPPSLFETDPANTPTVTIGPAGIGAVPEPGSLALTLGGLGCLVAARLRPRRRPA